MSLFCRAQHPLDVKGSHVMSDTRELENVLVCPKSKKHCLSISRPWRFTFVIYLTIDESRFCPVETNPHSMLFILWLFVNLLSAWTIHPDDETLLFNLMSSVQGNFIL
jgi:hypothetical protein